MDNSDDQSAKSTDTKSLRKDEIIRGHNSYLRVLENSISVSTEFLKAFINKESKDSNSKSPLFTNNVKVGFIIAKKKIKKSVLRNRIRRLLKESYRFNKIFFNTLPFSLNIIFSLNDKGYEYFNKNPDTKISFVTEEMKLLQSKIIKHFNI